MIDVKRNAIVDLYPSIPNSPTTFAPIDSGFACGESSGLPFPQHFGQHQPQLHRSQIWFTPGIRKEVCHGPSVRPESDAMRLAWSCDDGARAM